MFLALAFVIYLVPLFVAAVDSVDDTYLKTAYTLGASKTQAVNHVLLPISWPDIYQAMRLGFGVGWSYILLAEMVDVGRGLGGIIITSQRRGPREHIYLVLVAIVVVAFLTDKLWAVVGRWLFPYRGNRAMSGAAGGHRVQERHQDLQRRRARAVHGAPGRQLPDRRHPELRRVHRHRRPLRLRQVDDPEPDPGLRRRLPADERRGAGARTARCVGPGRDRGMIFQKYSSFPHRTVLENVTFGLELNQDELRLSRSEREARAPRVDQEGGPRRPRAQVPAPALGRPAAARRDRAHAGAEAADHPDGRAVLGARRADAQRHAAADHGAVAARSRRPSSSSPTRSPRRSTSATASGS